MSRVVAAETHLTSRALGHVVLHKGTPESEIPRELLEEKVLRLVVTPPRMEECDEPLLGDHGRGRERPLSAFEATLWRTLKARYMGYPSYRRMP